MKEIKFQPNDKTEWITNELKFDSQQLEKHWLKKNDENANCTMKRKNITGRI